MKLTNYRRDGTTFQNLLSLVPVFDTHGVYRFIVGLQFEVVPGAQQMRKLLWVQRLLDQLPRTMPVHYPKPARPPHAKPRRLAATKAAEAAARDDAAAPRGGAHRQARRDEGGEDGAPLRLRVPTDARLR